MMSSTEIAEFAARHVAPAQGLDSGEAFPDDLWRKMGDAGLLGLYLPQSCGGGSADSAAMIEAGEAFVRGGGNLGMAVAWFGHCLVARFFLLAFGSESQRAAHLPALARGSLTAAVAISEPGAGAHPKHLTSEAVRENGGFRLNGEKFYVTNGNIAGLFVVVAITEISAGRKRFSAFLVPRDAPGLGIQAMPPLDYLRPSQHVRLQLSDCRLPASALLGAEGRAFETMARPFRDVEDTLNAGPRLGGMGLQVDVLLAALRAGGAAQDSEALAALAGLGARLAGLRTLALEAAGMLDREPESPKLEPESLRLERLALAFRLHAREFQEALAHTRALCGGVDDPRLDTMTHELTRLGGLAGEAARAKQAKMGTAMMKSQG